MIRELTNIIGAIKSGKAPAMLLLFGDDLRVVDARREIVQSLVPESARGFNFERFDGRTAVWEEVEASLATPPFFPGKKVLWIENAPYFYSREQKGELGRRALEAWSEGRQVEAANLLADLLLIEGWSQERWEKLGAESTGPVLEALQVDGAEERDAAEALLVYCRSRGLDLASRKGTQGHGLFELLDRGVPEWDFLLLTAAQVDRRTRLYKRFEDAGAVLFLGLERDRYGRVNRDSISEFIADYLRRAGKNCDAQAREMILAGAGDDLGALSRELEKLVLFIGERSTLRAEDVALIFVDQGEGWIFNLTNAVADRDPAAALGQLARLIAQGEHPLKQLGALAAETRRLIIARQLLEGELAGSWRRGMSYQQFQRDVLPVRAPLISRNPYADFLCLQRADGCSLGELRRWLDAIHEADFQLKSSANNPRLIMERLICGMCLRRPRGGEKERRAGA